MLPIVLCALGSIPKNLDRVIGDLEIRGQAEVTRTMELLRSARILNRVRVI